MKFLKKVFKKIQTWYKHKKFDRRIKKKKRKKHFIYK